MPVPDAGAELLPELKKVVLEMFSNDPNLVKIPKGTQVIVAGRMETLPRSMMRDSKGNIYALYNLLGKGGFGDVKYAYNIQTSQWCAVKIQHGARGDEVAKLKKEITEEQGFMALFNMLYGSQERMGRPRKGRNVGFAPNENIEKFYTFQPLLTGKDLVTFLEGEQSDTTELSSVRQTLQNLEINNEAASFAGTVVYGEANNDNRNVGTVVFQPTSKENPQEGTVVFGNAEGASLESKMIQAKQDVEYQNYDTTPIPIEILIMIVTIMKNCAQGLGEIHSKNVLHRDLKPENIFINPDLTVKFIDFGISQLLEQGVEEVDLGNTIMGTIRYMPPEVRAGMSPESSSIYSKAGDVFGLGVVFNDIMIATMKQNLIRPYVFNNPKNLFWVDSLNNLAHLITTMTNTERTQRPTTKEVEAILAKEQFKMLSLIFKRFVERKKTKEGIIEGLNFIRVLKGEILTPVEVAKFLQTTGISYREALQQAPDYISQLSVKEIGDFVTEAMEPEKEESNPIEYLQTHPGHFLEALEILEHNHQGPLSKSEALLFAKECAQKKLCDAQEYREALKGIHSKFKR